MLMTSVNFDIILFYLQVFNANKKVLKMCRLEFTSLLLLGFILFQLSITLLR